VLSKAGGERQKQAVSARRISAPEIHAALESLAQALAKRHRTGGRLVLLGIARGGIVLAARLQAALARLAPGLEVRGGTLDISFHRDDIDRNPIPHAFGPTVIPVDVTGATIVLVDDVLHSGRTVKAALDELFDHGRPARVELAVLVDRGGRRLPVAADHTGLVIEAGADETVSVRLDARDPSRDLVEVIPAKKSR
jgi:pyrimidine operon attenuation protein / uracil phosphoribosyltransferase